MSRAIGVVFVSILSALATSVFMRIFGEPLIALIPADVQGIELLRQTQRWLESPEAILWLAVGAIGVVVWLLISRQWVYRMSALLLVVTSTAGALAGISYRLGHPDVGSAWEDPALWLVLAGFVAPAVLWPIKAGAERWYWSRVYRKVGRHRARWSLYRVSRPVKAAIERRRRRNAGAAKVMRTPGYSQASS
ncbi:hypothetical protein H4J02_09335 [Protaetiibacter sp. SSC-01]|uniref:hypothetical protein n=1 Tax=Protaetiibacter sp. SSC-01 TaxID=2759943 RepID=UPI001656A77E|nr:hypothetical protein [Protaetiibacter sp. SSC-01]QNO36694.1 hypothetical protein H4J02_09335 [Protaetiibacter sp. SSC-01]